MTNIVKAMTLKKFLEIMEREGFIKIIGGNQVIMRQKFIQYAAVERKKVKQLQPVKEDKDDRWIEFKNTYPKKEGTRPLHNNIKKCKEKYSLLVHNNEELHDTIIKALKAEIKDREEAGWRKEFRPMWKLMSTYINQEGWTMYEGHAEEDDNNKDEGTYGTELI